MRQAAKDEERRLRAEAAERDRAERKTREEAERRARELEREHEERARAELKAIEELERAAAKAADDEERRARLEQLEVERVERKAREEERRTREEEETRERKMREEEERAREEAERRVEKAERRAREEAERLAKEEERRARLDAKEQARAEAKEEAERERRAAKEAKERARAERQAAKEEAEREKDAAAAAAAAAPAPAARAGRGKSILQRIRKSTTGGGEEEEEEEEGGAGDAAHPVPVPSGETQGSPVPAKRPPVPGPRSRIFERASSNDPLPDLPPALVTGPPRIDRALKPNMMAGPEVSAGMFPPPSLSLDLQEGLPTTRKASAADIPRNLARDELLQLIGGRMKAGVPPKNKSWWGKKYKKCFAAGDAIAWLDAEGYTADKTAAVRMCTEMLEHNMFVHVADAARGFEKGSTISR